MRAKSQTMAYLEETHLGLALRTTLLLGLRCHTTGSSTVSLQAVKDNAKIRGVERVEILAPQFAKRNVGNGCGGGSIQGRAANATNGHGQKF